MKKQASIQKKVYWDACVFLEMIEEEEERRSGIEAILAEAEKGKILIHTSILTIAEVTYAKSEKNQQALDQDIEERINALWLPSSLFVLVDVFRGIVIDAQKMAREALKNRTKIKPMDAIHLATAVRIGCAEFHTFDDFKGHQEKLSKVCGLKIGPPVMRGRIPFGQSPKKR